MIQEPSLVEQWEAAAASHALHSKKSAEWYTPVEYVEAARRVMGGIDIDPASCALANETVRALQFFSKEDDGLSRVWVGPRAFINPPGGLVRQFWRKAIEQWRARHIERFIWIGYSLQQLQTLQTDGYGPVWLASAICYPRRRIAFINESGKPSKAPTHANYIAYVGANVDAFRREFDQFGEVR